MLKALLKKTWEYTGKICASLYSPNELFADLLEKFPTLFFGDPEWTEYLGISEKHYRGDLFVDSHLFAYRVGFWLVTGIPFLVGSCLDLCLGFNLCREGYGYDRDGSFGSGLNLYSGGPFAAIFSTIAGCVGVITGLVSLVAFVPVVFVLATVGSVIDVATRAAICVFGLAGLIASTVASALVVAVSSAITAVLAVCAVAATLATPFVWLGAALIEGLRPADANALVNVAGDNKAPAVVTVEADPKQQIEHYKAIKQKVPGIIAAEKEAALVSNEAVAPVKETTEYHSVDETAGLAVAIPPGGMRMSV
ncbi:MAG: hypothetical protein P4M14_07585 [Gammaproteobacteria bacterium]|nr:hypothetical protein [Gammaproteobacteria bacterium]